MGITYIPVLTEQKYGLLRGLLGSEVPSNFGGWGDFLTERAAEAATRGDVVRNVNVDPEEFGRYLKSTNSKPSLDALNDFTAQKSAGTQF